MYVFLRRAALFIIPLVFIAVVLRLLGYSLPSVERVDIKKEYGVKKKSLAPTHEFKNRIPPKEFSYSIILDPAHGSDDAEAKINLQFAFRLARAIRMRGVRVFLTRTADYNLSLEQRFEQAFKYNTALYLSINCACSKDSSAQSVELIGFIPPETEGEYEGIYLPKKDKTIEIEDRIALHIRKSLNLPFRTKLERRFLKSIALPSYIPAIALFIDYTNWKAANRLAEKAAEGIGEGITRKVSLIL